MKVRRIGVLIFIILILYSFLTTNVQKSPDVHSKTGAVEGTVTNIVSSKKCKQYYIGSYLASDMSGKDREISIGDDIRVFGEYNNLDNFYIKDFNFGRHLRSKGIEKSIKVKEVEILGENKFFKYLGSFKNTLADTNDYLYKEKADVLNAITLGIKDNLDQDTKYIFLDSGTSHIMAISGLHISIILSMVIAMFGGITNIKRLISMAILLIIYSLLVGGGASVNRAIELAVLSIIAFLIDERADAINLICIIGSIMIIENSYIIYNISFQLSFLAVLSILIFNKYIKNYVYSDILSVTVSSNILTFPIVAYSFKEVSLVGIVGNIVAIPFVGIIIFLDFLSIGMYFISIRLAIIISYVNASILSSVLFLLKKIGNFGVSNLLFRHISLYRVAMYYFIITFLMVGLEIYMIEKNRYKITNSNNK
ncbi:MAG: ComEC/Rec2 family competence protein [Peptostreptococcus sp.]|uniref:ComEC/Rec2 family competence protein n=1 Tax=Peptostreptococcus sp. TaxID=1262 RepID=UPI002FC9B168